MGGITKDTVCFCMSHKGEDAVKMEYIGDGWQGDVIEYILFQCPKCGHEVMVK